MRNRADSGVRLRRLRWFLGLIFVGLALPAALLIRQGFVQLELTEFRRQQIIAEDLVRNIDARLTSAIAVENARPATDFDYAVTPTNGANDIVQLSPLSSLAAANAFPGTIGYFQVDTVGELSTPLLPETRRDTLPAPERQAKTVVESELADVLEANRLLRSGAAGTAAREQPAAEEPARDQNQATAPAALAQALLEDDAQRGQAAFDELVSANAGASLNFRGLNSGDIEDSDQASGARAEEAAESAAAVSVSTFAGDLEPLRFGLLETGHFVLFRNAWRDGERFVQGMLIDRSAFLAETVEPAFFNAGLARGTGLAVTAAGTPIASLTIDDAADAASVDASGLYSTRLSPPLAEMEISFSTGILERGPGFGLLAWTAIALFGVLVGGFFAMYRYGVQQIRLARQQQNFVSAVSHELKTPLTSIRMYGEMLKSGWADDEKKQVYYDYIFDEGERLSRLIDNVLQLARLNKSGPAIAREPVAVTELFDVLRSKLSSQAERAGFELRFEIEPGVEDAVISAEVDALTQVFINLVDNAIKFSGEAGTRKIHVTARSWDRGKVLLAVRDFGPGIPAAEMKRLFELFYRPDNELTRTTAGTGIGLSLVKQLVTAMAGRVDVRNRDPGAEFRLIFPRGTSD